MLIALVVFVFNSFLVIIFSFCSRSRDFSLTWESNSLSDYRRVRLLSLKPRLFLCCPHSTTLSFRLQLPSFSIYPSDGSREWYFRWLRFFSNLIERLQRDSRSWWITPLQICLILHILRKPNSLVALLFIQNNSQFKNIAKTRLPASMLSSSLRQCTFRFVQLRKYSPNSRCHPSNCLLAVLAMFLAIISPSSSS